MSRATGWTILIVGVALAGGLLVGSTSLSPSEVWAGLRDASSPSASIVRDLRLPRVLLAFAVGGSLAVCGASLQALVRNPLADPYLLGLSGGAGFGAVTAMAFDFGTAWAVPIAAFVGALASVALVYQLSLVSGRRLDPRVLLLAGVIVGSFASAMMTAIITLSPVAQLRNAFLWLLGGLSGASWQALTIFSAYAVLPLLALLYQARALDLLALGEEPAQVLGAELERTKRIVYLATSLLTAASVSVCGIIGFVGLAVPHAVRRLRGPMHLGLLPLVFLVGGAFLVLADTLARTIVRPLELPVGVVTALVGVPAFTVLLRKTLR